MSKKIPDGYRQIFRFLFGSFAKYVWENPTKEDVLKVTECYQDCELKILALIENTQWEAGRKIYDKNVDWFQQFA